MLKQDVKKCNTIMAGLMARMKAYVKKYSSTLVNHSDIDEDSTSDNSIYSYRPRSPSLSSNPN